MIICNLFCTKSLYKPKLIFLLTMHPEYNALKSKFICFFFFKICHLVLGRNELMDDKLIWDSFYFGEKQWSKCAIFNPLMTENSSRHKWFLDSICHCWCPGTAFSIHNIWYITDIWLTVIIPPTQRSCWMGILVSLCPSVRLSRIPCPLCSAYSSGWIHFIFTSSKVCHV